LGGNDRVWATNRGDIICSGSGNDIVTGRDGFVAAGSGDDEVSSFYGRVRGGSGADTIGSVTGAVFGGPGDDDLRSDYGHAIGGPGNDALQAGHLIDGGPGDDELTPTQGCGPDLIPGPGDDVVHGGYGSCLEDVAWHSTLDLSTAPRGVRVDLTRGISTGWGHDRVFNIRNITGSRNDDVLIGRTGRQEIDGSGGDDTIKGRSGNDYLVGGYDSGGGDAITGGAGNDKLLGNKGADRLLGGPGRDRLTGAEGDDVIDGGGGDDTLSFFSDIQDQKEGVYVNLATGRSTGPGRGHDSLESIETVQGSGLDDVLIGDSSNNTFWPDFGNDRVEAAGGDDLIYDTIDGYWPPSGDDSYDGGEGLDTVSWVRANEAITVDLSTGTATGNGNETLMAIEIIIGSYHDDHLTGDDSDNQLFGGWGDDFIDGRGGSDFLDGDAGTDTCLNGEQMTGCP
jgi:Ca2+-binding RTX toxin-like protein